MFGFLFGIVAGFVLWHMGYFAGYEFGKQKAADEWQEFIDFLEPVDRLHYRLKLREFLEKRKK